MRFEAGENATLHRFRIVFEREASVEILAIGRFESGSHPGGYGHLSIRKYIFTVLSVEDVKEIAGI
jgi:hypothetical protein